MTEVESIDKPASTQSIITHVAIALALGIGIMMLPSPDNLPPAGQRLLGLLVTVVYLWVSEAVPIGATALLAAASMILLKIQPAQAAWAPFASPAVMFVLMVIMFGVVLNEVGLANRLMFYLLKFAGTKIKRLSLILAIGCTMTSTVFHDATITVIMVFAFVPVFISMGLKPGQGHKLPKFFMLLIPLAASAGGFGTLLGGGRCPLAVEILQKFSGGKISIGFLEFIVINFPLSILTAVLTWAIVWIFVRPEEKELAGVALEDPGPMSRAETGVFVIFVITFTIWFMGDWTGWHYSVPAAFAILAFCGSGMGKLQNHMRQVSLGILDCLWCGGFPGQHHARQRRGALSGGSLPAPSERQTHVRRILRHGFFRILSLQHDVQLRCRGPDAAHYAAHVRDDAVVS